ncbi:MAG: efflux RND transporter periplasmic adaptor subunit [Pedosphaera sp.]|nr:efflux RND transporter periplasmic adaptor subunit [Pedosphaera sp.]
MRRALQIILPLAVLVIGFMVARNYFTRPKLVVAKAKPVVVPLFQFVRSSETNHQFIVDSQGTITPRMEISVVPEVSGKVISVSEHLVVGGIFKLGEELFRIDQRDYEIASTNALAQIAQVQVRITREEAEADAARKEWEALGRKDKPSPLLMREPQLAEARAALLSAEAALALSRRDQDRCVIRAPFDCRVSSKSVDLGQVITRGTPLARLQATDFSEVRLPVPLDQLAFFNLPMGSRPTTNGAASTPVTLRAEIGGRTLRWDGAVFRTDGEIDPRTRMISAVGRVRDPYRLDAVGTEWPLMMGLFVTAEIKGHVVEGIVKLPREALRGTNVVYVLSGSNRLSARVVEVMHTSRTEVIIKNGIKDGELICVTPMDTFMEGMAVRIEVKESAASKSNRP